MFSVVRTGFEPCIGLAGPLAMIRQSPSRHRDMLGEAWPRGAKTQTANREAERRGHTAHSFAGTVLLGIVGDFPCFEL
jgi:hypothetical protein